VVNAALRGGTDVSVSQRQDRDQQHGVDQRVVSDHPVGRMDVEKCAPASQLRSAGAIVSNVKAWVSSLCRHQPSGY
jgi:hypothetical protein